MIPRAIAPRGLSLLLPALLFVTAVAAAQESAERGAYLLRAAGGCGCHTDYERDGPFLAGGKPVATPFGTYYSANITPDSETGLGAWSEEDFLRAMRQGIGRDGSHLFPVFPYTSFTRMREPDLRDMWAYLNTVEPVKRNNRPHGVWPPFSWRFPLWGWKALYFKQGAFNPDPTKPARWNRGAYLVNAVGHCGECHTPRNFAGALKPAMHLAGSLEGAEGKAVPNITPHEATGIGAWSDTDIVWYLENGLAPDGESAEGLMGELIEHGYSHLRESDLQAIAAYLKSIKPIRNEIARRDE
ncbi:MAG: cytochrome C [SAR324 cluster bacterium]|nr:cytochrome C [SAR324 cluster bacterium]